MMLFKNAYLFTPDKKFVFGSFSVEDGLFKRVMSGVPGETGFDLQGAYVIPGLIDIHTHGCAGADFTDGDPEGLAEVKKSNLETYGHEEGPAPEELFAQYGSWTAVLQHAFSTNMGMDACCGLYDNYYRLYQELGL